VALVIGILGLVFAALAIPGKIKPKIAAIILILGFIFALITPVLMAVQLPAAMKEDKMTAPGGGDMTFIGSKDVSGTKYSWEPSFGWILMFIAMVFLLLGAIMMFMVKSETPTQQLFSQPSYPQQTPQMYPQQYNTYQQQPAPPQYPPQQYPPQQPPPQYGPPPGY
jgi:hypothetical protein